MANQERLDLSNESNGLNRNLDIGSASATVQLINETKTTQLTNTFNTSNNSATNANSKKKNCISSNTHDDCNNNPNKHKINASNDQLKSSKTFETEKKETKDGIQMKNFKKSTVVNNAQVKINLVDEDVNKLKKEKSEKSLSNQTTTHTSSNTNNRKKFFEFNFSKINRKTLKRPLPCLFAWTLLIGTTGAYFAMVSPKLLELLEFNYIYWFSVIGSQSIIFLYVLVNFLIATLRDPGRFPKVIISPDDPSFNDDTKSPLYKTVTIKKTQVKIKWCSVRNN
jgi:hypothetical protein